VWLSKGLWAVTDQGLFALTNFSVSVLLGRWLSKDDYGAFAIAFSVLLLMGTVHTGLLTEPMLVLGPGRFRQHIPVYVRRLVPLHFAVTSAMAVLLSLIVVVLMLLQPDLRLAGTLIALAASAPAILLLWLMRRACYLESLPHVAAAAGLAYAVLVPAGMLVLTRADVLTAGDALILLGLSSLPPALWLLRRLTRSGLDSDPTALVSASTIARAHWEYGRWALGSGLVSWVPANAVVLALPLWHSLADAATLRVASTLILPVLHVQGALAPLLTPTLVRARLSGQLRSTAIMAGVSLLALSVAYAPLVLLFGPELAEVLFGGQYSIDGPTLWLLAAIPLAAAFSGISTAVLRAMERPDHVLWAYVAATGVTVLVGLPLVHRYSVDGALGSMLLSTGTTAIAATLMGRRFIGSTRPEGAAVLGSG
jgi:O-antigen/teichoic acid export membrane protein